MFYYVTIQVARRYRLRFHIHVRWPAANNG